MAKFRRFVKRAGRKAWKAIKKVTGDRYGRGWKQISTKGIPQMVKDINYLKSAINSEKLRFTLNTSQTAPTAIGQINGNAVGYHGQDITPTPSQGDGYNNRTGSSIKLHSSNLRFMFVEQANTMSDLRFKVMLFEVKGKPTTAATAANEIFQANPFTGIIDYNSTRNPDYYKDYKLLRIRHAKIPMNPASLVGQTGIKEIRVGMKYKSRHVRWDKNTSVVTSGQIIMFVFCDSGNCETTASTLVSPYNNTSIPVKGVLTGGLLNYYIDHFYYDN